MDILNFLPGFIQGIVRVTISYPFDYVRTNLQANKAFQLKDMYKGLSVPLVTVPFDRAIQFYVFEHLNKTHTKLYSSIVTSCITSVYSVPINYLQTRIMLNDSRQLSYRGYSADFLRSLLSTSIYLSSYGYFRDTFTQTSPFFLGIFSSTCLWTAVYPLDTIRVKKQASHDPSNTYMNILKQSTFKSLYKGYPLVIFRSLPSSGFGMLAYEYTREYVRKYES
jgi:hypothetical protein